MSTSYYYWIDVYTPSGASWVISSYIAHREYPTEAMLVPGVTADEPSTGQYRRIRGPVVRTANMTDPAFMALMQPYRDNIPPTPFDDGSSSS